MTAREDGFLNLLKPPGMSSHDVVGCARRVLGMKKVGHAGTLDPGAAGVLPGAWNIGDAEKMRQLLDMGVFRIYADAPLAMLDVRKEREKR